MDVCHILLGKPRQYDRRTLHDGYKNTFAFYKYNLKIVLGPTHEKLLTEPNLKGEVRCLSTTQFLEEIQETGTVNALVGKEVSNDMNIPKEMEPLMQRFKDVFLDK